MLQLLIAEQTPDTICLQETNLNPQKIYNSVSFKCFRKDRVAINSISSGGVATLVKDTLEATTNLEAIVVKIKSGNVYFICNLYLPSSTPTTYNELKDVFSQIQAPRIIVGDFSSHNIIWGSFHTDARGNIVETIISDLQLNFLNDGSPARFNVNTGNSSVIDLSLCDPQLTPRLFWEALQYTYGSDHHPNLIKNSAALTAESFVPKWKTGSASWTEFESHINLEMLECTMIDDVNESLNNLNSFILSTAELFIGKTMRTNKKRPPYHGGIRNVIRQFMPPTQHLISTGGTRQSKIKYISKGSKRRHSLSSKQLRKHHGQNMFPK